ncbi:MAG: 3-oxoacyl-[acyl-carrier-protein] reductase [Proteobacteria bacterium]|nr:3-oxoacyl-[acyl-carrier-protein] reductase [Pseudomonadota bacterium]
MFDLKDKKALVTGATGALGEAIARALVKSGASVAISGTRIERLKGLAEEIGAIAIPANLSSMEDVDRLAAEAQQRLGGLDILVNNAGITRDSLLVRMSEQDWQDVLKVNLEAAFRLSKACLRGMMKARFGRIISITSIVGVTGNPGQANYAASKAGLIGFSKSLAQEVASRGITVNCIAPGFIESPMTDGLSDDQKAKLVAQIPLGRMGTPDEIAAGVLYLASDEASYITGQTLHINGGMAMI